MVNGLRVAATENRPVEQVADRQVLLLAGLEPAGVDHPGDDHLVDVDRMHPLHREEDPAQREQLNDQSLDPRRPVVRTILQHDVAHLADLVPRGVKDR